MKDPTIEMVSREIGEQQTEKVIEEIKKSGIRNEDLSFALASRLAQMQSTSTEVPQTPGLSGVENMPPRPANWGVPPVPAGMQLPPGAQLPPQPMGPAPAPPASAGPVPSSNVQSPLGPPPITAQTGYYREEGSSDTRRR